MIDIGKSADFGIIAAESFHEFLNRIVEIENQGPCLNMPNHALHPEERSKSRASRDRSNRVQAECRVENEMSCEELYFI